MLFVIDNVTDISGSIIILVRLFINLNIRALPFLSSLNIVFSLKNVDDLGFEKRLYNNHVINENPNKPIKVSNAETTIVHNL